LGAARSTRPATTRPRLSKSPQQARSGASSTPSAAIADAVAATGPQPEGVVLGNVPGRNHHAGEDLARGDDELVDPSAVGRSRQTWLPTRLVLLMRAACWPPLPPWLTQPPGMIAVKWTRFQRPGAAAPR